MSLLCLGLLLSLSLWECVSVRVHVAACLCVFSWHQKRPWTEWREGPGEKEKERESRRRRRGWNNKGWWKMTSLVKEVFLKAPHLTQAAMPYRQDCPPPLPLTHRVPGCTGRADSLKPLTAAPWVGSCVFTFTCRLRGLILKPMIAPMCHNWQQNENTLTGLHDHLSARWG